MRKRFGTVRRMIVLLLIVAMLGGSALAASGSAKVLTPSMKLYSGASSSSGTVGSLSQKTSFKVTATSGGWAKISYKGKTAFAQLKNIIFDRSIAVVASRDTSMRFVTRKSYSNSKYYSAKVAKGAELYVVGIKGSDALVTNANRSALGYVSRSALKKK